ncbi:UDP-2-acetamido-2,6-beta-L-arabino-hexul-4-ose reductase [Vogesella alkaliphila]|uniref:UDP-2-acetamido-2,6-dideoxy-beta-L-talose 4-dehydrogenase n=1 Tax=Vogesella alkaliphila TaxID=1193621 RepID=A0ABQ2YGY0_9NEIS|nr:NAD-dependent epimerase/dehydratase family protein [Vogesella alkaliphila]GGX84019.1 UDP-2-acetamido-2,6-dideoxy-beta-L-talose 4-dehydrogenase [Vogesella alkaliphila]
MKLVITGAHGFVGKNLQVHLQEAGYSDIRCIGRDSSQEELRAALADADFVFHLAGINRPQDVTEFHTGNVGLTEILLAELQSAGRAVPVAYTSSTQATLDNPYGVSKLGGEHALLAYGQKTGAPVYVFRLPNIFGKWCRPFYNSAVATFCHQIARGEPITIHNPDAPLRLVYIDDVCRCLIDLLGSDATLPGYVEASPVYDATVGALADQIQAFRNSREMLVTEPVGTGLVRALYATYVSHLPHDDFAYTVPSYGDSRGVFVEMLKTKDSGQFSFFTAHPGITRGGHYHHSKTEKFLVIRGEARFGFRHILTGERLELVTSGSKPQIVETIPGWIHDITNIGDDEMIVMLWANEIFDRQNPDTIAHKV